MSMRVFRQRLVLSITLITCALATVQGVAYAQSPSGSHAKDRVAINQLIHIQQVSWNKGDVDTFMEAYWHSPDLTFSGASGVERGYDGVLARYKKAYPDRATM